MELESGFYLHTCSINSSCNYDIIALFDIKDNELIPCGLSSEYNNEYVYKNIYDKFALSEAEESEMFKHLNMFSIHPFLESYKQNIIKMKLYCGQQYHNIYRPLFSSNLISLNKNIENNKPKLTDYKDIDVSTNADYYNSINQLEILLDELKLIFKTVAPHLANLKTFGHNIRNVIILACTEIDAIMKNIMLSNEAKSNKKYYTTADYVKLKSPLCLDQYSIKFNKHLDLGSFNPFKNWSENDTTKSIKWYDAYNKIKHDRSVNYKLANLQNALQAVSALAIIIIAQYGYRNDIWMEKIGKILNVETEPNWDITDFYFPYTDTSPNWSYVNYPFQ